MITDETPEKKKATIPESFGVADVLALIKQMNEDNQRNMISAIQEMKKPSAREQKDLDEKEARIVQHQKARLNLAKAEENRKIMQRKSCQHGTTHAGTGVTSHQWRGQIHTPSHCDPYFLPTCTQCGSQLDPVRATTEMLTQGVNLDLYKAINLDVLLKWGEESWKGHEARHPKNPIAIAV